MKKFLLAAMAIVAVVVMPSCKSSNVEQVGTAPLADSPTGLYQLDVETLAKSMMAEAPPGVGNEQLQQMMQQMVKSMRGSIELMADNTCAMSMTMMGQKQEVTGVWSQDGSKLTITAQEEGKEDDARVADYADGVITVSEEKDGRTITMRFVRSAK